MTPSVQNTQSADDQSHKKLRANMLDCAHLSPDSPPLCGKMRKRLADGDDLEYSGKITDFYWSAGKLHTLNWDSHC